MSSYAVTGASRGLGLAFIRELSSNAENTVFALVRNVQGATELQELAKSCSNIHIVHADLLDNDSLKAAALYVSNETGGSLDYLINNAAYVQKERRYNKLTDYIGREDELDKDFNDNFQINVVGVVRTVNAFLPLLKKGSTKKVVTLTSGLGDLESTLSSEFAAHVPYSASKAAVNIVNAKYANEFRADGFLFLAISPGVVATDTKAPTPDEMANIVEMIGKFKKHYPQWNGQLLTPAQSVKSVMEVINRFTSADSGAFVSHFGNKQWL